MTNESYELEILSEKSIFAVVDEFDNKQFSGERFYEIINRDSITTYRCPQCDRLWLEEGPNKFTCYVKEIVSTGSDGQ